MTRCGLKTVINLQRPGEHASCGNSLAPQSGFTYRPEAFMEAGSKSPFLPIPPAVRSSWALGTGEFKGWVWVLRNASRF